GVSYGATAGYLGGRLDNFMMRVVDIMYAIPYMFLVIILLVLVDGLRTKLPPSIDFAWMIGGVTLLNFRAIPIVLSVTKLGTAHDSIKIFPLPAVLLSPVMLLFIALGAVQWLTMARIVRGQVLSLPK